MPAEKSPDRPDPVIKEYAVIYPPLITFVQAAAIAQRPITTIYDWSSRGHFDGFRVGKGRQRLLRRDDFVGFLIG